MRDLTASRIPAHSSFLMLVFFGPLAFNGAIHAAPLKAEAPTALLREARGVATTIDDRAERSTALDPVVVAQIAIDPSAARDTLRLIPKSAKKLDYLTALAAAHAGSGNIVETERIYADIVVDDQSSRAGKLAAANALGQVAIAYAIMGNVEEASNTLSRVKERFPKEERLRIVSTATATLVDAQAKQGDVRGAVQTALTIITDNPDPLIKIFRDRSEKARELQDILAGLDEGARQYAQWGMMQAQIRQGRPRDAQVTASSIKPGPAKVGALMELATYHLSHGTKPLALVLLQEAEASARAMPSTATRAENLRHIAANMATAGDAARAISLAKSIEQDGQRRAALYDIIKAQAKRGEFAGAFNTATMLKQASPRPELGVSDYEMALSEILMEMVKAGKGTEAKDMAATLQDADTRRSWLYSGIAAAYADLGRLKEAKTALALAETEGERSVRRKELRHIADDIRLGHDPPDQSRFRELSKIDADMQRGLAAIAKGLARQGDLAGAVTVADELNHPVPKLDVIRELSTLHAQAGRHQHTLRWARNLSSTSEKVFALVGIATALSPQAGKHKSKPASQSPKRAGHN